MNIIYKQHKIYIICVILNNDKLGQFLSLFFLENYRKQKNVLILFFAIAPKICILIIKKSYVFQSRYIFMFNFL